MRSLVEKALLKAVVKNDIRLTQAMHYQKPAVVLFGRVTQLDGVGEKIFYRLQKLSGRDEEAARTHCWNAASSYTDKLNALHRKIS